MIKKYKHRLNAVLTLAANSLNCLNMSKKIVTSRIQIRPKNSFSFSHSIKIKEKNSFMFCFQNLGTTAKCPVRAVSCGQ